MKIYAGIKDGRVADQIAAEAQSSRPEQNTVLVQTSDKNSNVSTLKDLADGKSVSVAQIKSDLTRTDLTPDQKLALTDLQQLVAPDAWFDQSTSTNPGNPPDSFTISNRDVDFTAALSGADRTVALADAKYQTERADNVAAPGSAQSDQPLTRPLPNGGSETVLKGQLTQITYPDGSGRAFDYDASGKLTQIFEFNKSDDGASYKLDDKGNWVNSDSGAPAPYKNPMTSPDGGFSYTDASGKSVTIASDGTTQLAPVPNSNVTIDNGQVTKVAYPDGSGRSFEYDSSGKLTQIFDYNADDDGASY
ncbi:MAG: hypothetical protein ACRD3W_03795, partial [Terriglobales bacterium]